MHPSKTPIIIGLLLLSGGLAFSQVSKSSRSASYGVPKVSRGKALVMCPIFEGSQYPYQGLGFKVGDPFALTYKFYANRHWAFAMDAGRATSGLYNKYHRDNFQGYLPDTLSGGPGQSIEYLTHTVPHDWFVEAKFLYQWDAEKISRGLQLYAGLGWQWRNTRVEYQYLYNPSSNPNDLGSNGSFTRDRFTFGPVALVGFEYSYFTLPLSAFIEVEMFTDTFLDPGYQRFQGGVGLRYIF